MGKTLTRKEILKPRYEPFASPDAGKFLMLPFISAGALEAYMAAQNDPQEAFARLFGRSVPDDGPEFGTLTEADCDTVARFLAQTADVGNAYCEQRPTRGVFEAFSEALLNSALVAAHNRANESLARHIWQIEFDAMRLIGPIQDLARSLSHIRPIAYPDSSLSSLASELKAHKAFADRVADELRAHRAFADGMVDDLKAHRAYADSLVARFHAIDDLSRAVATGMETWKYFINQQKSVADALRSFDCRMADLADHMRRVQTILKPIEDLHQGFIGVADRMISSSVLSEDLIAMANITVQKAGTVVLDTNDHFMRWRLGPGRLTPIDVPRSVSKACNDVSDATLASELLLHEEASNVILIGNNAVEIMADRMEQKLEERIDERLKPYQHLLQRLRMLSHPPSFLELLREFSVLVSREFWKTLWRRPGTEWLPRPERVAQGLLGMFLHGHWAGIAFVGREIASGDGFVDILVNFLGADFIVELKIVGAGWGIGRAKDGLDQLDVYMDKYSHPHAYLVVFDGRKTGAGEQLHAEYILHNGTASVVTVRVYEDAPSG